jgi:hypothetical protein
MCTYVYTYIHMSLFLFILFVLILYKYDFKKHTCAIKTVRENAKFKYRMFQKSFATLKAYMNLFSGRVQCFELT